MIEEIEINGSKQTDQYSREIYRQKMGKAIHNIRWERFL